MSKVQTAEMATLAIPRPLLLRLLSDYAQLSKIRLNAMVVFSTAVGFIAGSTGGVDWLVLLETCAGVMLAAMGASAFNQALEAKSDAHMNRTRNRPVPAGRISRTHAAIFGMWLSVIGVAIICPTSNGLAASITATNILLYVLVYTPLKRHTSANTLVGAVVGALPPVIGWVAAFGSITDGAIVLGALLFMWQIPHFLALAWMYRADYAKGGYKMLPNVDPAGSRTANMVVLYSLGLVLIGIPAYFTGITGLPFLIGAAVLGLWLALFAIKFARLRTDANARKLFLFSVIYLPLLLLVMLSNVHYPYYPKVVNFSTHAMFSADIASPEETKAVLKMSDDENEKLPDAPQKKENENSPK